MYSTNNPTYNTRNSKVRNFGAFDSDKEKAELKKVDRSFVDNEEEVYNLPNEFKFKFNNVTHKMDDESRDSVEDRIEAIEEVEESINTKGHILKFKDFK